MINRKITLLPLLALVAFPAVRLSGQTSIDLRTQSKSVDFSNALSTRPVKSGIVLPALCMTGELYFKTNAPAGANLYACTALNTWTLQSGGGGPIGYTAENAANKGQPGGYAGLDAQGVLPAAHLPLLAPAKGGTGLSGVGAPGTLLGVNAGGTGYESKDLGTGLSMAAGTFMVDSASVALLGGSNEFAGQNSFSRGFDVAAVTAPALPPPGWLRLYGSTTGGLICKSASGSDCLAADYMKAASVDVTIDAGAGEIAAGVQRDARIPHGCMVQSWTVLGDQSGSIRVSVWKAPLANYPPGASNSITGTSKPAVTGALYAHSTDVSGWSPVLAAGDVIRFHVDSASGFHRVAIQLGCVRTE